MARKTELLNTEEASVAVVESLAEKGNLDERNGKHYNIDSRGPTVYPMMKTESGALQLPSMPWDLRNRAKTALGISFVSFIVGASLF
jgi:hypothetical protein